MEKLQENILNTLHNLQQENLFSLDPLVNYILSKSPLENQAETEKLNSEEKEVVEKIEKVLKELQDSVDRIQTYFQDWQDFDKL